MSKDEQARARLVEIALATAATDVQSGPKIRARMAEYVRQRAGFRNPATGSWCAAGLTAAMEDAGLVVPAPGTPARRGAVALLDFVYDKGEYVWSRHTAAMLSAGQDCPVLIEPRPGDIIAWLQNKAPAQPEWRHFPTSALAHLCPQGATHSMCRKHEVQHLTRVAIAKTPRCSSCVWETRKGHVALIVAVDDESITTVGWNEGAAPGRVMKRKLWRDPLRTIPVAKVVGRYQRCVRRASTVLYRRPGGLYGIARPVAR